MWEQMTRLFPDHVALSDPLHGFGDDMTYSQASAAITRMAGFLQELGVQKGDKIALFSENSYRWSLVDSAILQAGAVDVVRGATAPVDELKFIYSDSGSKACVVENVELLEKLVKQAKLGTEVEPEFVVVMYPKDKSGETIKREAGLGSSSTRVVTVDEMLQSSSSYTPVSVEEEDTATLLYTSGTTGHPKGVVLTHGNLLHQMLENVYSPSLPLEPLPGDVFLCILPCWHIFERFAEYYSLVRGAKLVYSSVKTFKSDLLRHRPHILVAVPRLYENVFQGVQAKFAAGSSLQRMLVAFFTAVATKKMEAKRSLLNAAAIEPQDQPAFLQRSPAKKLLDQLVSMLTVFLLAPFAAIGDRLIWSKVREGLGGRIKCLISGGSKLPTALDNF
uniref:AMP-dependent synthetase/ligase domain-containing protein n=1 Tax=Guillardia theta (strain CCMP2712) TaxID=905079 RepID=A0A0C3TI21_GUITC